MHGFEMVIGFWRVGGLLLLGKNLGLLTFRREQKMPLFSGAF